MRGPIFFLFGEEGRRNSFIYFGGVAMSLAQAKNGDKQSRK
jgi:hypothetical protein